MKVNPVGKKLSEVELAYIAGFLDADGCIMATIEPHKEKRYRFRVRITLKITQSKKEIIKWFHKSLKHGSVQQNRTIFDWITRDQEAVYQILNDLMPYLKVKKTQAEYAQKIISTVVENKKDFLRIASLADALSRLNVRSKNRRKNYVAMIKKSFSPND
jgi:hypothetical protein